MIKENFVLLYQEGFKQNWDLPALSDLSTNEELYYKDLAREIARIHVLFDQLNIKKGDKIALIGRNNIQWCSVYIAAFSYGAIIVPILQEFHPENVQHIIDHSDSRFLFADTVLWNKLDPHSIPNLEATFSLDSFEFTCLYEMDNKSIYKNTILNLNNSFNEKYPHPFSKDDVKYAKVDNSEVVLINYTSGTTGFSKGVMLTANNLAGNVTHAEYLKLLFPGQKIISFLPLAHAYGCAFEFLYALYIGAHVNLLGKTPAPKILSGAFAKVKPHLVISVPLILEKIYKNAILPKINEPKVKFMLSTPILKKMVQKKIRQSLIDAMGGRMHEIIIGGAALNPEVEDFLCKIKFPLTVGYGMTECGPLISYDHNYDFIPSSCGKILDNIMEVRVDSEDPYNIPGEIQVRGENVMLGYFKNEKATQEAFTEDKWLRTGDLGTIDENNRIFIKGRCKTMLLSGNGQNIYPEEIEAKISNLPFIAENLIIQRNAKLVALIYPDYEAVDKEGVKREELINIFNGYKTKLNSMLAAYENISSVEIQETEFEKTPKKSIKRFLYQ